MGHVGIIIIVMLYLYMMLHCFWVGEDPSSTPLKSQLSFPLDSSTSFTEINADGTGVQGVSHLAVIAWACEHRFDDTLSVEFEY